MNESILLISKGSDAFHLAMHLAREGADVRVWVKDPAAALTGTGFGNPARVPTWQPHVTKADLILFDHTGVSHIAESLKKRGLPVFGANEIGDKMELDRAFGDKVAEEMTDCGLMMCQKFSNIKAGIKFLETQDEQWCYKPDDGGVSKTFVPKQGGDNSSVISFMEVLPASGSFILQKMVSDPAVVEVSSEIWFHYKYGVIEPRNHTLERKRFMEGDKGSQTGCAGNTVWNAADDKLFNTIFTPKLLDFLTKHKFVGVLDANCLVTKDAAYFLEWSCFDEQTEVLTQDGFKLFRDLTIDDEVGTLNPVTHTLEYQKPTGVIVKRHDGEMVHFAGSGKVPNFDVMVTPDHQMYMGQGGRWTFLPAAKVHAGRSFKRWCGWSGAEVETFTLPAYTEHHYSGKQRRYYDIVHPAVEMPMDTWLKFLGIYIAEGCLTRRIKGAAYIIDIAQHAKKDAVRDLLTAFPFRVKEHTKGFRICSRQLAHYIEQLGLGLCNEKFIPTPLKQLSVRQLNLLLDALIVGDGNIHCRTGQRSYFTTSKRLADDVQELFLKVGSVANVKRRASAGTITCNFAKPYVRNHDIYVITERRTKRDAQLHKQHIRHEYYVGNVYCCDVPNHIICTRRNGTVTFNGNCRFGYDGIQALMQLVKDKASWFHNVLDGYDNLDNVVEDKFALSVRMTIPPAPHGELEPEAARKLKGLRVLKDDALDRYGENIWLWDVYKDGFGKIAMAGSDATVCSVVATGPTITDCRSKVYTIVEDIGVTRDLQYRLDIGDEDDEAIRSLVAWGWVKAPIDNGNGWIGIDLDGTLAEYHGFKGAEHIGRPIKPMLKYVKRLLSEGETVKLFTARAGFPENIAPIKAWLKEHGIPELEITNVKDSDMKMLIDDRAKAVLTNTGIWL